MSLTQKMSLNGTSLDFVQMSLENSPLLRPMSIDHSSSSPFAVIHRVICSDADDEDDTRLSESLRALGKSLDEIMANNEHLEFAVGDLFQGVDELHFDLAAESDQSNERQEDTSSETAGSEGSVRSSPQLPFDVNDHMRFLEDPGTVFSDTMWNSTMNASDINSKSEANEPLPTFPVSSSPGFNANVFLTRTDADALVAGDLSLLVGPMPEDVAPQPAQQSLGIPGAPHIARRPPPSDVKFDPKRRRPVVPPPSVTSAASSTASSPTSMSANNREKDGIKTTGVYRGMSMRDAHNAMERERRIQLRENFEALKSEVPALREVEKAATLQILKEATDYIRRLRDEEAQMLQEKSRLLDYNKKLRSSAVLIQDDNSDVPPLYGPPGHSPEPAP